ncbi:MAG: hypothetical protein EXR19_02825 [Chitinophagaceae bacterium]|nr:hypothetical protein [Chitinophagaceae bacterium]
MKKKSNQQSVHSNCLSFLIFIRSLSKEPTIPITPEANLQVKSLNKLLPEVETTTIVSIQDNQVKELLASSELIESKINFKNAIFYKIKFKGFSSLSGLHIVFDGTDSTSKDLFYVVDLVTKTDLSVIREKIGFKGNNKGRVIFKEPNGREFANDYFDNQKIISDPMASIENSRNSFVLVNKKNIKSNAVWKCTKAQFNAYYQEAKNTCSNDWLCDFACTFNPCAISYAAFAVGKCSGLIQ